MRVLIALLASVALLGGATAAPARPHVAGHSERLAARARRGDNLARATLVEEHMGLVRSVAVRYRNMGLPVEDLVQEGAIGLLAAIDDYDASRGASFSTYAFWRIRAAVTHSLTAQGRLVRMPRPLLERRRRVARARNRLAAAGRDPTVEELAAATTLPASEVAEALSPVGVASLDQPAPDGSPRQELVVPDPAGGPEAQLVRHEEAQLLHGALRHLGGRKRTIVRRYFGMGGQRESLTEIAGDLDLSPERTRALKDEALRDLARALRPAIGA
jgi:RNA polymerase primary sigma factor